MAFIPLSYNLRSLAVRRTTTAATAGGVALVVLLFSSVNMLTEGIHDTLSSTGSDEVAIVMSKGADAELSSNVDLQVVSLIQAQQQVAHREGDVPDAIAEMVGVLALEKLGTDGISNVLIRGTTEAVWAFRPTAHIIRGRKARPGSDEVVIGRGIAGRFRGTDVGQSIELRARRNVQVVGVFEDSGSSFESELWADTEIVRTAFARAGLVSAVRVRLNSATAYEPFRRGIESNRQLSLMVLRESDYYEKQSEGTALFLGVMGSIVAFFFSIAAMFGAMITMYAAVASRTREIGLLRALGFSRFSILTSFLFESVLLSMVGGVVGALVSLATGLIEFPIVNFASFSETVFHFTPTPGILIRAVLFAGGIGLLGGFFPAIRAARVQVLEALRG